jgi:hypothetical protein
VVFAKERGLEIAVHSGGHDILGASVCDGGLMIDLSPMKTTQVDPRARIVRGGRDCVLEKSTVRRSPSAWRFRWVATRSSGSPD